MQAFEREGLIFDVLETGPADGPVVLLLHGFPQGADSWRAVAERLAGDGYRCLAPLQRGYSPGARPAHRRDYAVPELVADVLALVDASGADKVHLVGHDWGAAVAWAFAAEHPERLLTLTALSVPHPGAFASALLTSRQSLASTYVAFFQLPWLPERLLTEQRLRASLESSGQSEAAARRDARLMVEGALTGGLNWYRAVPFGSPRAARAKVAVPTLFLWSDGDAFVTRQAARTCGQWVTGPYRFEVLEGLSHWLPDEAPDAVSALLSEHFLAHQA
ncbi:MAG: Alpha/beta hydrolase [Frankiales bacterium]|nr:Alpha/beta hydrolase [Frankiales bacterium]